MKYLKYFESRVGMDYHRNSKSKDYVLRDFMNKIYKQGKINSKYILTGYKDEFVDFVKTIRKYNKGEASKKELGRKFISFLKLIGMTVPIITNTTTTIFIILSFKKWGLDRYLPDSFKNEIKEKDEKL